MGNKIMKIDACCTIGMEGNFEETARDLVRQMDSIGVDMAVIHPADHFYAWDNEAGNRMLLDLSKKYEGRLIPVATVNPWRPDANEVVMEYIEFGAKMLSFAPGVQGFNVSSSKLDGIIETMIAKDINLPVYVHTGHHSNATPAQLLLLAERFKEIDFICGHSGSTDFKGDAVFGCKLVDNLYLESSFARPCLFATVVGNIGENKAVMGSGYPYNYFKYEWQEMEKLLSQEYLKNVLGENLFKLINMD
jgi:uncharacterized protein